MLRPALLIACCCVALAGAEWKHATTADTPGLPGDEIQFLKEGQDGRIWIGTLSGLGWYHQGTFTTLDDGKGKPLKIAAWDVLEAAGNQWWIGHGNGVLLRTPTTARSFLAGNTVAPLLPFGEGNLWSIAKDRGTERNRLVVGTSDGWQPVAGAMAERIIDGLRTNDGTIWLTVDGDGLLAADAATAAKGLGQATHHLQGLNVTALHQDRSGRLWTGTWGRGISVYGDGAWTAHLPAEKNAISALREDAKGGIWAITAGGSVWHYDGKAWHERLRDEQGLSLLATTRDGRVFISAQSGGGLRAWDGKAWTLVLPSDLPLRTLIEAADGTLWVGGILDGLRWLKP